MTPGTVGALCALSEKGDVAFKDFTYEIHEIVEWINTYVDHHDVTMCMIEDVHAVPGGSAGSTFKFGFNTGIIHGVIRGMKLPLDLVKPKAWQKHIGVTKKGKEIKKNVAEIVRRLYPTCDIYTPRGRLIDGRSDALGIAAYCKFKHS